jgi:hypothetical protein
VAHVAGAGLAAIQMAACERYRQLRPGDHGTRIVSADIHAGT